MLTLMTLEDAFLVVYLTICQQAIYDAIAIGRKSSESIASNSDSEYKTYSAYRRA